MSLILVVAITVGFLGRRSQLSAIRDQQLSHAAELASARVDAIVDNAAVLAATVTDPSVAVQALTGSSPESSACATGGGDVVCDGSLADVVDVGGVAPGETSVVVATRGDVAVIEVSGKELVVWVAAPRAVWSPIGTAGVRITNLEPVESRDGVVERAGLRHASVRLESAAAFVVATVPAAIEVPEAEQRFYLIVALLALLLLALGGTTVVVEQRALRMRATTDVLTLLPNRGEFERIAPLVLDGARRSERSACLLLFDLNGFKLVNDTHGHRAGDEVLRRVGERLRAAVRADDVVARWGGDEFVVMMVGIESEEMAVRRARQIADQIADGAWPETAGATVEVDASVGIAMWPRHATDLDGLLEVADQAMYRAKRDRSVTAMGECAAESSAAAAASTLATWPPSTTR